MVFSKYHIGDYGKDVFSFSHVMEKRPNPKHFSRHCHDGYELIYVVEGEGSYVVEGEKYNLHAHSLLLLPPHAFHHVEVDFSKTYERYVVNFKAAVLPQEARKVLDRMYEDGNFFGRFYKGEGIPSSVVESLMHMQEVENLEGEEADGYILYLLAVVLLRLSVNAPLPYDEKKQVLGARVIRYLNAHLTEDANLENLAKLFFVSKYHLCRAFKEHNGVSVVQYLTEKRVMYAKHLLEQGETAAIAASKAGFGDYSSFYRAHRRICGIAPKDDKVVAVGYPNRGMKGEKSSD